MAYVHRHPRLLGWVVAHYRRPNRPGGQQLSLAPLSVGSDVSVVSDVTVMPDGAVPEPRLSPEVQRPVRSATRVVVLG